MLWFHSLSIGHSAKYLEENEAALNQAYPRIPLPGTKKALEASADLGRLLAALLDPETAVTGVTTGSIRAELKILGNIAKTGGGPLNPDAGELAVTAGWGHGGKDGACMPGRGDARARPYTPDENKAIERGMTAQLGETCLDIHLNDHAFWRCVPAHVWDYTLGGYQVLKKWLSYREKPLLGRDLTLDEAREVTNIIRRIAAILLLTPGLDANYKAVTQNVAEWK